MVALEMTENAVNHHVGAIGAIVFDLSIGELGNDFYLKLDGQPLGEMLKAFSDWLDKNITVGESFSLWGNGPRFDILILTEAYEAAGLKCPYQNIALRDFQEMRENLFAKQPHNALEDAKQQARCAIEAYLKPE